MASLWILLQSTPIYPDKKQHADLRDHLNVIRSRYKKRKPSKKLPKHNQKKPSGLFWLIYASQNKP